MKVLVAVAMWLADIAILTLHHGKLSPGISWLVIVFALLGGILIMVAIAQAQARISRRKHD